MVMIPVLLVCWTPLVCQAGIGSSVSFGAISSSDSSKDAGITVALFAAVVGVLFLVGLKSDIEKVFVKKTNDPQVANPQQLAESIAWVAGTSPSGKRTSDIMAKDGSENGIDEMGIGVRIRF